jgi:hypothetical protein
VNSEEVRSLLTRIRHFARNRDTIGDDTNVRALIAIQQTFTLTSRVWINYAKARLAAFGTDAGAEKNFARAALQSAYDAAVEFDSKLGKSTLS